jgi:glucokinase
MSHQTLQHAIGVDLGGTKIGIGVVDQTGRVIQHQCLDTLTQKGVIAVESQILTAIHHLRQQTAFPICGVGIGVAGQVHPKTGQVIFAPNLKWNKVPLQTDIARALQLPVYIVNDVRAITWGEWLYGAGKGCDDMVCLFVGTGIGGSVVSGGRLLTGCSNTLGEVGHLTIDFNGPLCTCGNRGCLEAFAGGWGIAARAVDAIKDGGKSAGRLLLELAGQQLSQVTAKKVIEAYRQGDALAQRTIEQAQRALIAGCTGLVNAFNPSRLILGGGLIEGLPEMVDRVNQGIHQYALKAALSYFQVVRAQLGPEAGIIGSAAVVFHALKQAKEQV